MAAIFILGSLISLLFICWVMFVHPTCAKLYLFWRPKIGDVIILTRTNQCNPFSKEFLTTVRYEIIDIKSGWIKYKRIVNDSISIPFTVKISELKSDIINMGVSEYIAKKIKQNDTRK